VLEERADDPGTNVLALAQSRSRKLPTSSGERIAARPYDHPPAIPALLDHVDTPHAQLPADTC
jgi:hypothetical protein